MIYHYGYHYLTYSLWPPHPHLLTSSSSHYTEQAPNKGSAFHADIHVYLQLVHTPCYAYSMNHLISFSSSSQITKAQSELLWKFREHCSTIPEALPKFQQRVDWASLEQLGAGGPQAAEDMEAHRHGCVFQMAIKRAARKVI